MKIQILRVYIKLSMGIMHNKRPKPRLLACWRFQPSLLMVPKCKSHFVLLHFAFSTPFALVAAPPSASCLVAGLPCQSPAPTICSSCLFNHAYPCTRLSSAFHQAPSHPVFNLTNP